MNTTSTPEIPSRFTTTDGKEWVKAKGEPFETYEGHMAVSAWTVRGGKAWGPVRNVRLTRIVGI